MTEREIFEAVQEKSQDERQALLDSLCGADQALRQRIEVLLDSHQQADSFLSQPAIDEMTTMPPRPGQFSLEGDVVGSLIGPYKLLQKLGEGGMGIVWVAEQERPVKRRVALKLVKAGMDTAQVVRRFEAERQALAMMDHTNIAKVLDVGTTSNGRPYFVMELVKGVPITRYCDEVHASIETRLDLFVQVCSAVQHAHQKGIIHRDIKPSNILIAMQDGKPVPKVIDFGVAKALHTRLADKTMYTEIGQVIGTLEYMAPEQAELSAMDIDTRADIYALGVVLYELLTGSTPITHERMKSAAIFEVLRIIKEEEPPKPSTRLTESKDSLASLAALRKTDPKRLSSVLKGELDWVVLKALEKDRTCRYETANALARDIQRYLADEVVEARPPSAGYRLRKIIRRNRGIVLATTLIIFTLALGFITSSIGFYQAEIQRQQKVSAEDEAIRNYLEAEKNASESKRQKHLADQEAQSARRAEAEIKAFSTFLVEDVLSAARPQGLRGGLGREITVREALEKCSPSIPMRFVGQPRAEALAQHNLGVTFRLIGDLPRAEWHLRRAVTLREQHLGAEHVDTLSSKNSLAVVLNDAGKPQAAITLFEQVLANGVDRLEPATRFTIENNMCLAYRAMGQWKKSLAIQESNLKRGESLLGKNHEEVLTTRMNYAAALHDAGELARSRELYAQVLATQETILGPKHPTTLHTKANYATLCLDLDDIVTARKILEEVVENEKALLGPDHHSTLTSLINLAAVYREAGEWDRSISMYRDVIERQKKQLGPEHYDVFHSMHNLAVALRKKGEIAEAMSLLNKVIEQHTKQMGPNHPSTLANRNQLAGCYLDQGRYATARAIYQDILTHQQREWGDDHPDVLRTQSNLALTYLEEGKLKEALPLYQQLLDRRRKKFGADHESALTTLHRLAVIHMRMQNFDQAEPLFQELLDRTTIRFGKEHPETLSVMNNYATLCFSWKKLDRSIPLFEKLLTLDRKLHGPDHPSTLLAEGNLAINYLAAGKTSKALPLIHDMLARGKTHPFGQFPVLLKELSALLLDRQLWAEAEPLVVEQYSLAQKNQNNHKVQLALVDQLLLIYQKTQQPDKAANWQSEKEKLIKNAEKK